MNTESQIEEMDPDLPHRVVGACLSVHQMLGSGLSKESYESCLAIELRELEIAYVTGKPLAFLYRGKKVQNTERLDFLVEDVLLVQVLAQAEVKPIDLVRVESVLRLSGLKFGLIVNFHVDVLRKGVHRVTLKRRSQPDAQED